MAEKEGERRLSWGDRITGYLTNEISEDTSTDTVFDEIELADDVRQFLVIEVNGDEFTEILTAIMTGADLLYNDKAHQVTWLVWKAGKGMTLCDSMAWCVANSETFQEALNLWAALQGWAGKTGDANNVLPTSIREDNLLPEDYTCDSDHRFGMSLAIVGAVHSATTEVFEAIEIATNPLELAAEIGDNVPIFEVAATAADFALWVQSSAYEAYQLAWSDVVRDELACDLFCAMLHLGTCQMSFETIFGIYLDVGFPDPPSILAPLLDWALWVMALPLTGSKAIVQICSLMGLLAIRYGGAFGDFSLGVRTMETTVSLAADDESSDWSTLCPVCPTLWEAYIDFTTTDAGFVWNNGGGTFEGGEWVDGVGWIATLTSSGGNDHWIVLIEKALDSCELGQVDMLHDFTKGYTPNPNNTALWTNRVPQNSHQLLTSAMVEGTDLIESTNATYYANVTKLTIGLRSAFWNPPPEREHGYALIKSLTIKGDGIPPDQLLPYII